MQGTIKGLSIPMRTTVQSGRASKRESKEVEEEEGEGKKRRRE